MSKQIKAPKEFRELISPPSGDSLVFLKTLLNSLGCSIKLEKQFWGRKNWTIKEIRLNTFNFKESTIVLLAEDGEELEHPNLESFIQEFRPKVEN